PPHSEKGRRRRRCRDLRAAPNPCVRVIAMQIEITSNKLPGLSAALRSALARVVETTAAEIEGEAKLRAPVDTGYLRSTIGHEFDGLNGSVFVAADYG